VAEKHPETIEMHVFKMTIKGLLVVTVSAVFVVPQTIVGSFPGIKHFFILQIFE